MPHNQCRGHSNPDPPMLRRPRNKHYNSRGLSCGFGMEMDDPTRGWPVPSRQSVYPLKGREAELPGQIKETRHEPAKADISS